ncbi:bifunctional 4-hydroxy-3-methylbut-2-enyl diphosphate reductase/30S ribosomal protein S1 [Anaeromassilibacillus sp. An200]|uniref:4-hydroxy-3-methylbut-2-enyl diphosphate reductase n=1 Tax=Candidatus Caccousia stercoris TaxID=2840723 RepID=A0A9D1FS44_9FIRM|nr:bifunctional 4-hydroxy-3-methylbut-2-enyl diphosphate reductase/30S ribosomal protein S1 [Anaeromassilibacillus sp. An200]OUP13889.1 bifunctional 4-hydroxy-3-methylbut-2-enyl diphosphate reductase/30S ribosomal protein S1 [Anaeromassilibacillus sp. An200]HIS78958.1 bifunctional 4-hydroxy-3-methylbut-2-enyl diphosphate reductase/30S ribosomal protein S1 [Candidatus Caccousia stercoris]
MKITVAKTAGFCFGVNRAVETVNRLLDEGEKVWTLGPIIHNPQTLASLEARGVRIAQTPEEARGGVLVIRSHGVARSVLEEAERGGVRYVDATCPFVAKIHRIVQQASEEGRFVLIAGDRTHPEVQGIVGHCRGGCFVFSGVHELEEFTKNHEDLSKNPVCVVSQTTFSVAEWKNSLKIVNKVYTNAAIFDTICNATANRQSEAEALSRTCDAMVIVGGKQSSNTAKLFDVCRRNCASYFVEDARELPLEALRGADTVGITAGASTPASIIKEVLVTMTEIKENQDPNVMEDGASFEAMLEESLKSFNTDEKVRGVVVSIAPNEVYVDVGRKQAGFIPVDELSADPNVKPEDIVKVGDEIELLIMRTNDQEGTIMLSKKRLDAAKGWEAVAAAAEDGTILDGTVTEILPKGGIIAVTHGVRVFIPASQATASRGEPLEGLLKKDVRFRIIEVNRGRRRAVGSIRSVLADERKALADKFWETAEEGKEYTGTVKSLTSYGAFVDLGGIDGMIHISELSWDRIKHPSEVVNVGDTVEVYIKGLDREKGKISLGYKRQEDNPWEVLRREYPVGSVVDATVVGMTTFGAFARIIPGIDGLIHISQIADHRIEKPQDVLKIGDVVKVKITEIDFEKKRVSLSIRALLEEESAGAEDSVEE